MIVLGRRKLQVFVSSTYNDLKDERQAAVSAILTAGHIPAGMELFTSGDQSQMEVIQEWIDESDVYMVIIGGRYGSIENISGLSYTELEYDYARSKNKPLFAVVCSDTALDAKIATHGRSALENEQPTKLKDFREKVLGSVSRLYDDSKDIKLAVHETLQEFTRRRVLPGWIQADAVEDPKPLRDEVARLKAKISELEQELDSQKVHDVPTLSTLDDKSKLIIEILQNTKVIIPDNVASGGVAVMRTLCDLFISNRDLLASGTVVGPASSDKSKWFSQKIYTRYITHNLMKTEQRPNNTTFYSLTMDGFDVLALIDRRALENKPPLVLKKKTSVVKPLSLDVPNVST